MTDALPRLNPPPFYRAGSGEPLLLLHAFALNWQSWGATLGDLSQDFDVLAPTQLCHWGGPKYDGELSIDVLVGYIEKVMDDAGWATAHIAGNSLGGATAFELAKHGRARSVTGVASAGLWREGSRSAAILRSRFSYAIQLLPAARLAHLRVASQIARMTALRYLCHRPNLVPADLAVLAMQSPTHCQRLREFLKALPFDTGIPDIERINVPITVLFAEQDKIIPPRYYGQQFVTEFPAIRTRTMPDVGHIPMLEAPNLVAAEIRASIAFAANRGAA